MKIFIFPRVDKLTENYHPGGGLVVIADDLEDCRLQIAEMPHALLSDEEWADVRVFDLAAESPTQHFIFPDAGCC